MNISGLHYYKWVLFILQRFRYLFMLNNKKKTLISLKPSLVLISLPSVELVRIIQDHWKNGHLVKYLHWIVVSDIFRFFFLIFGLSSHFTLLCFSEGWHVETSLHAILGLSVSERGIPEGHSGPQESSFSPRFPVWSPLLEIIVSLVGANPTHPCLGSSSHPFPSHFQKVEDWLILSSHHCSISVVLLRRLLLSEAFLNYHVPS